MEWLWILLAIILIVLATWWRNKESMTNADVQSAMQEFGTPDKPPSKKKLGKKPIYGPKAGPVVEKKVEESDSKSKISGSAQYPDIYGPDIGIVPGTKTDKGDDSYFTINTDLERAFPTDGKAPQPYLTDFSKIQR